MKSYQRLFAIKNKVYYSLFKNIFGKKINWISKEGEKSGWILDRFILFGRKYFVVFIEKEKSFIHLSLDSEYTVEKEKKFFKEVTPWEK